MLQMLQMHPSAMVTVFNSNHVCQYSGDYCKCSPICSTKDKKTNSNSVCSCCLLQNTDNCFNGTASNKSASTPTFNTNGLAGGADDWMDDTPTISNTSTIHFTTSRINNKSNRFPTLALIILHVLLAITSTVAANAKKSEIRIGMSSTNLFYLFSILIISFCH